MKKNLNRNRSAECPVQALFMAGFLLGMIVPNILWKIEWHQKTIASMYLLSAFATDSADRIEYFFQVLKIRGSIYLLGAACGISVFGVPCAVAGSIYLGMKTGLLLTMSVLQFGFQGGLVGIGLLMPQYIFYIPCIFYLYEQSYRQSVRIWKNREMFPAHIQRYFLRTGLCGMVYLTGILMETFVNPGVIEWLMQRIN